jgi:DNA-binding CsgD family transcriptional regulator
LNKVREISGLTRTGLCDAWSACRLVTRGGRLMPGPLQVIAVSFSFGSDFQGRVLAEVDRLQGRGVLRLLDVMFVAKNDDGTIEPVVVGGDDDVGALLSSILPFGGGGVVEPTGDVVSSGFALADAWALAESLLPGTALAVLLVEHGWAQALFDAVAESGGALLGEGFLTAEAGLVVGAEVAALEDAAAAIAVAQATEARATLAAMAAETQAAEAIAASEAIVAGAAAVAVQALIDAGIVQEAAAHEAVEALNAAGLIVAAADQTAAEAVAEDAAAVRIADQAAAEAVGQDATEVIVADQAAADAVARAAANVAAASITVAEARVLRYLPTGLTFALIADKLGISRSAAKERAERAYKKLGVHSRADAVDRARALGMIE